MTSASQTIWSAAASRRFAKREISTKIRRSAANNPSRSVTPAKKDAQI